MTSITDISAFARTIEFLSDSGDHLADDVRAARRRYLRRANGSAPAACSDTLLRRLEELAGGPLIDDGSLPVSEVDHDMTGPGDLAWCRSLIAQREAYQRDRYLSLRSFFEAVHFDRMRKGRSRADQRAALDALLPNWNDPEANEAARRVAHGIGQGYTWQPMLVRVVKILQATSDPTPERMRDLSEAFAWVQLQRETLLNSSSPLLAKVIDRRTTKMDENLPWWRDDSSTLWEIEFNVHKAHRNRSLKHGPIAAWLQRQQHIADALRFGYNNWLDQHTTPDQRPTKTQMKLLDECFGANWREDRLSAYEKQFPYAYPGRADPQWVMTARSIDLLINHESLVEVIKRFEMDSDAWPRGRHHTALDMFATLFNEDRTPKELHMISQYDWWDTLKSHYRAFERDKEQIYARRERDRQAASDAFDEQMAARHARWLEQQPQREANNKAAERSARLHMQDLGCQDRAERDPSCHCQSPTYKRDRARIERKSAQSR